MNYKVGEQSEPKKIKYYKSYTKKTYIIWKNMDLLYLLYKYKNGSYCIMYIVYQKYYIVSGLYYCIILYIFLPLIVVIVLIVSFGHAEEQTILERNFENPDCYIKKCFQSCTIFRRGPFLLNLCQLCWTPKQYIYKHIKHN
jgi:hypothetical protein